MSENTHDPEPYTKFIEPIASLRWRWMVMRGADAEWPRYEWQMDDHGTAMTERAANRDANTAIRHLRKRATKETVR